MIEVARQFGKKRIILWGGVLKDNVQAIGFYKKVGFKSVGEFTHNGLNKIDMIKEI